MVESSQGGTEKLGITMSFIRTFDILNRYLELELVKYGTSPIRFAVMNAIILHGGSMTPTAISKWVYRSPRTITSMLDSLERDGLIKREANKKNRRSTVITVTKKGWDVTKKIVPANEELSQSVLSCLDDKQIETLKVVLKQLRKHLLRQIGNKQG